MWQKSKPYLFVFPTVGAIGLLFFGGIFEGFLTSLGYSPFNPKSDIQFTAYIKIFNSSEFWVSFLLTLRIAVLSSILSGVMGVLVSVCLMLINKSGNGFWQRFFQLPLTIPHLVGAYLMVLLFMQSGWISRILFQLGFINEISDFPVLVNETFGWGIILTYTWKEAPFIALMVYPVLVRINGSWRDVAQLFGANQWQYVRQIVLPLIMPAWTSATFIVFAFTFSAFEVPYLLGVTYPRTLSVYSFQIFTTGGLESRPEALAINLLLAVITAILGIVAFRLSKRWIYEEPKGWNL